MAVFPPIRTLLKRGLRKRCPHCGEGALYEKGISLHDACAVCHLVFLRNQGDPWAFLVAIDRFFLLPIIAAIYFGFMPGSLAWKVGIFTVIGVLYLVTTPNRYGVCVALDYFTRARWRDPDDTIPPYPPETDVSADV